MNLSRNAVAGVCRDQCDYQHEYGSGTLVGINEGILLRFLYDSDSGGDQVEYNQRSYRADSLFVCAPSLHQFAGRAADAELVVVHRPIGVGGSRGSALYVSIPLRASTREVRPGATGIVESMLRKMVQSAPSRGEEVDVRLAQFSIEDLLPRDAGYFAYTNSKSSDVGDWVVYDAADGIPVSINLLDQLAQIVEPYPMQTSATQVFWHNSDANNRASGTQSNGSASSGSTSGGGKDGGDGGGGGGGGGSKRGQLYIRCKPTGASKDKVPVEGGDSGAFAKAWGWGGGSRASRQWWNQTLHWIIALLCFVAILWLMLWGFRFVLRKSNTSSTSGVVNSSIRRAIGGSGRIMRAAAAIA